MKPEELSQSHLLSAVDGARIVYFDGRLYETALVVAKEVLDITLFVQVTLCCQMNLALLSFGFVVY